MLKSTLAVLALVLIAALARHGDADAAVISVGAFPELNPAPATTIPAGTFLVPVDVSGALNLQSFQFDLLFDPAVVQEVDPFDGSSGIYGAEFVRGNSSTQSFILGGFPFNSFGLVDDVAGSYPGLLNGVTGDGTLAYILFAFVGGQETNNPGFTIANASTNGSPTTTPPPSQIPEPSVLMLLFAGALLVQSFVESNRPRSFNMKRILISLFAVLLSAPVFAQTVSNGPYYATPSWDQTLPANTRFVVLSNFNNAAVLDRETGLVWERAPSTTLTVWASAQNQCIDKDVGGRKGWKLPSIQELFSLVLPIDPFTTPGPALPLGHPFVGIQSFNYWSSTTDSSPTTAARTVYFGTGGLSSIFKTDAILFWCVRGGSGNDIQ